MQGRRCEALRGREAHGQRITYHASPRGHAGRPRGVNDKLTAVVDGHGGPAGGAAHLMSEGGGHRREPGVRITVDRQRASWCVRGRAASRVRAPAQLSGYGACDGATCPHRRAARALASERGPARASSSGALPSPWPAASRSGGCFIRCPPPWWWRVAGRRSSWREPSWPGTSWPRPRWTSRFLSRWASWPPPPAGAATARSPPRHGRPRW